MSRKEARETVFKLVYERCVTGESNSFSFEIYTEEFYGDDRIYIERVYGGINENFRFLNDLVQKYSKAFKLERVYKVDLSALLVATYEILFFDDIPYQISVNEAVELSKKYSTEKSYRFVNGILSSVIRDEVVLKEALSRGEEIQFSDNDDILIQEDDIIQNILKLDESSEGNDGMNEGLIDNEEAEETEKVETEESAGEVTANENESENH